MTEALGQAVASREATRGGNWGSGGLAPEEVTRLMESMVGDGGGSWEAATRSEKNQAGRQGQGSPSREVSRSCAACPPIVVAEGWMTCSCTP